MLKIDHFTKTYGDKKAVDDLTLHIQRGEIYGFIGHNGAGKTTTLKSVAGIMQLPLLAFTNRCSSLAQSLSMTQKSSNLARSAS